MLSFPLQQWLRERNSLPYDKSFVSLVTRIRLKFYMGLYLCVWYVSCISHNKQFQSAELSEFYCGP